MSLGVMTTSHPRFEEFIQTLSGPGFCNFRTTTWDCDGTAERSISKRLLRQMGASELEVAESMDYFASRGGFCDCEIIWNVTAAEAATKNSENSRKNPKGLTFRKTKERT